MLGHHRLIAMRNQGYAPTSVWVQVDGKRCPRLTSNFTELDNVHVDIQPTDNPGNLDLRCLTALRVWVDGESAKRVHEVRDACVASGAERVIASTFVGGKLAETTDTEGVMTWPN